MHATIALMFGTWLAFLPVNWNPEHAKADIEKSDHILRVRCVGIRLVESTMEWNRDRIERSEVVRTYLAQLRVSDTYKGASLDGAIVEVCMGYEIMPATATDDPSTTALTMCNSQAGYDFRINQVYIVHLMKTAGGFEARSGPFSLGWLTADGKIHFGMLGWRWQDGIPAEDYIRRLSVMKE